MSVPALSLPRALARGTLLLVVAAVMGPLLVPGRSALALDAIALDHLVVSEIVTGGTSASDELIELYNPTADALPLEGLELVYVSASGATVSPRAAWDAGSASVPPGGHLLVANEAGMYAAIADALYGTGMAAAGGSVALRIQGASAAIDAVGWGTAASTWREGTNASAPTAGASLERLPGGSLGSTQDTDDNAADFVERSVPEPQNMASAPVPDPGDPSPGPWPTDTPSSSPTPSPSQPEPSPVPSPSGTPIATATTTPTPAPIVISVAAARAAANGTLVTIEAGALTASDFHDGGGFVADATGGIAVLLDGGSFARGGLLRVTGIVDDRFSQRTIRAGAAGVALIGTAPEPAATAFATGAIDESTEGALVRIAGLIDGSATVLTSGVGFDLDDGSGAARVVVPTTAAIDVSGWTSGTHVELIGVGGQRDSSGSGTAGYRVMPRGPGDVIAVGAGPPSPTPSPSVTPAPEPTPAPDDPGGNHVVTIDEARATAKNARVRVRGVVTMGSGIVDPVSAFIQDATGAIVLRLGEEIGPLEQGVAVEILGTRSTKSGMETLRVTDAPRVLGTAAEPAARTLRTGEAGEAHEATLVLVRGELVASARRSSAGSVSFDIDDGSGPLRISLAAALAADDEPLSAGTWVEVRGVLGQETTGAQPARGYRVWPRTVADLRVLASTNEAEVAEEGTASAGGAGAPGGSLAGLGGTDLADVRVGATLVSGPWAEIGVGGLLWDGSRLVAIAEASAPVVTALSHLRPPPAALELANLRATGTDPATGATSVTLGVQPGEVLLADGPPSPPTTTLPTGDARPAWVSLVGRLALGGDALLVEGRRVAVERRCDASDGPDAGMVALTGVAAGDPLRLVVPCDGLRVAPIVASVTQARPTTASAAPAPELAVSDTTAADRRHLVVAGLLMVGALLLAGAVVVVRRIGSDPPAETTARDVAPEAETQVPDAPPHLTLVRVPHERGP